MAERVPPQNLDAEQSVLGAVLLDPDAAGRCADLLRPEEFYREAHRRIWEAVLALSERRQAVDVITVGEELGRSGQLEATGGLSYLSDLIASVPATANAPHYARIVAEKALLRDLLRATQEIAAAVDSGEEDADGLVDQAEAREKEVERSGKGEYP